MAILVDDSRSLRGKGASGQDLTEAGQQGNLRNPASWANSSRYVKQRLIPVLVQEPPLYKYLPDSEMRIKTLKELIENRATEITGLNSTLTVNHEETKEGNSGEMRQTVTQVTMTRSEPDFAWPDNENRAISSFWEQHIKYMLGDPELGHAGVAYLASYQQDNNRLPIVDSTQTFTVLFIEPTKGFTGVVQAWLCANMGPTTSGDITGTTNVGEALEAPIVQIPMTAMTSRAKAVYTMAENYIANLNKLGMDPDNLVAYSNEIGANVAAADDVGYASVPANNNG